MFKWRSTKHTVVRLAGSTPVLVAATVVTSGWKWI